MNLGEEPFGRFSTRYGFGEARVVSCVLLEILPDVVPFELGEQTSDIFLVFELGWVRSRNLDGFDFGIEFCDTEEVASATSALP